MESNPAKLGGDVAGSQHIDAIAGWGIDGCRAGWVCVGLDAGDLWQARVVEGASDLAHLPARAGPALIDIPIGLIDKGAGGRGCDKAARKVLGFPRSCSVFSAPSRPSLAANSYRQACDINHEATGRKISRQAFGISRKIREVDEILRSESADERSLRECHPEVCFWALNDGKPMKHNKKKRPGRDERRIVLERFVPHAADIVNEIAANWPRKEVALDDIVDALVAALTARLAVEGLKTLPETPDIDACGLPMEIVYVEPASSGSIKEG